MSNVLINHKQQRQLALDKADAILKAAEVGKRTLTDAENENLNNAMAEVDMLNGKITTIERSNTLLAQFPGGTVITETPRQGHGLGKFAERLQRKVLSAEYAESFFQMIASGGKNVNPALSSGADQHGGGFLIPGFAPKVGATLYEGSSAAGGYAVPISVDDQIVPLAPQEMAVRQLAMVIPTTHDIKFPVKASFGAASAKAETSAFTESDTALSQFTLSAFMAGIQETISWELAQDVPAFQAFAVDDMLLAQQMYEENLYINGTGSGQAQGLIGNVGAGYGPQEPDSNGNLVSITGTLNLIGTLNAVYHPGASWLMQRATSILLRKAQVQTNLFYPAFTRVGDTDYLHGYPVRYATAMPSAARGNVPVLFGDFKRGYIIGDRGGAGINVKVLDQVQAQNGLLVLLAYRRTDGRVRRSEAIQQYQVSAS